MNEAARQLNSDVDVAQYTVERLVCEMWFC